MPSFGHGGHLSNQGASSGFAPIAPEAKPEDRPVFFAGARHGKESKYAEGVGRKRLRLPKELKDEGDKLFASGTMLEEALSRYTEAIANLDAMEARGEKAKAFEGLPPEKKYTIHHNRAMCLTEMRRYPEALEDAEAVISTKPKWVNGYLRKGAALFAMARFEDARLTYEQGMDTVREGAGEGEWCGRGMGIPRSTSCPNVDVLTRDSRDSTLLPV